MTTKSRLIVAAVITALTNAGLTVHDNPTQPQETPDAGMVIVRDGQPRVIEQVLGGFDDVYCGQDIELELYVQSGDDSTRNTVFDALIGTIQTALYADKTFGGLAYGFDTEMPEPDFEPVEGQAGIKAGVIILNVEFSMDSPLG